jgi:hypothetical protein
MTHPGGHGQSIAAAFACIVAAEDDADDGVEPSGLELGVSDLGCATGFRGVGAHGDHRSWWRQWVGK